MRCAEQMMEVAMAQTPVEVKQTTPARVPDVFQSFRAEMDRLFDGLPAVSDCLPSDACSM
jgi:hypothetical protein